MRDSVGPPPEEVPKKVAVIHCDIQVQADFVRDLQCFSLLAHHPIRVTPTRADSLLASGRPLTRNRKESGRGSGSHLTRAFAGSKPLFGRAPYSLYTHCSNAYRPLS